MNPKHQKITTYDKQQDGSTNITTKSYYEELSHLLEEVEKPMISTDATLIKDVESMLSHIIVDHSPKLTITIAKSPKGYKVTKKYVLIKKKF
jgi:hypothetical protein